MVSNGWGFGPRQILTAPVNPTGSPEGYHTPWDAFPLEWFRAAAAEQAAVRPYFQGDFYPLLSYSLAADAWAAWQCDRPDLGEGCVVALRRPESPFRTMTPALHALEPEATYELRDADSGDRWSVSGKELTETGLTLEIAEPRGSRLIIYRRVGE